MIVHMIGNAHLDPVWLWPWQEGVDEALSSFRSACDRLDEYPEFTFTRGEAWLYFWLEKLDPELFARVQKFVAQGRWHIVGGQWVQPDTNLPTLVGWKKQLEHGSRYFQSKFGVAPRVGYNVDSFGHPATLPDILSAHGLESYVFHRPNAQQVQLPSQTFRWRGTNGGEVVGFRIAPAYVTRTDDLYGQIRSALDEADADLGHTMCFYGVGNHGGGPTKGNIEYILEHQNSFEGIELRFSSPQTFFDAIREQISDLPIVDFELQRTFPGCYSVMHDIKSAQHRGELELENAENVVEAFGGERKATLRAKIDAAWPDLLFTQFHDILAGTSIASAWASVRAMQGRARLAGEEAILEATRAWARANLQPANTQRIVALNGANSRWKGLVETTPYTDFDAWNQRWIANSDGESVPFQLVQSEAQLFGVHTLLLPLEIEAQSGITLEVRDRATGENSPPDLKFDSDLEVSPTRLANSRMRLQLGANGVNSLTCDGRELLGENGWRIRLRHDSSDTWGFHVFNFSESIEGEFGIETWEVEESGPLRARVRCEGRLGNSRVRWTLSLERFEPRLHITLEVLWDERFRVLQMPIHLAQNPTNWTDGLAGGSIEREPKDEERPLQSWSRVRIGDLDFALVTPDAYSISLFENEWNWTLLRSPKMAWGGGQSDTFANRDWHTDAGAHSFEWLFTADALLEAENLHAEARNLVQKPTIFDFYEGMNRPPWRNAPARRLWTGAEQRARQDGHMMHLEDDGAPGHEETPQAGL